MHGAGPARRASSRLVRGFLPRLIDLRARDPVHPATVSDRSDGKIAHLDGLNLSRAWCWRSIAPLLPAAGMRHRRGTADEHLAAALPHVAGDYMGEHWLASFALLAMLADSDIATGRCRLRDLNPRPSVYKTAALPLS